MSRSPALASILAVVFLLTGCATEVQKPGFSQISFAHLQPISLNVARIEVENRYVSPATRPNVEHEFPVSPAAVASNWGRDRLRAVGQSGVARVVVRRASVVEVPLKRTTGVTGAFTRDQSERYDAIIDMMVELRDADGNVRVTAESTAKRSRSVSENVSLIEREKIWFEMTETMMSDLNTALENQVRIHMKEWIR
ncbi:hypothetical protein OAW32_00840 [bacterium]|jgi:hypothetical protein|nr:hypothetical protein [Rhodospirillaceae bacterium]MDC3347121.1 hypothetical protein [bacterium]